MSEKFTLQLTPFSKAYEPRPPRSWLVDNMLINPGLYCFAGDSGSGKTWAVLDLALRMAQGENWMGRSTQKCAVLILDEESGDSRLLDRLQLIGQSQQAPADTPVYFTGGGFDLTNTEHQEELARCIDTTGAGLLIIDSFSQVIGDKKENEAADMNPIMGILKDIVRQCKISILFIHHTNKGNQAARGSGAIKAAVDMMLHVSLSGNFIKFSTKTEGAGKTRDTGPIEFLAELSITDATFSLSLVDEDRQQHYVSENHKLILSHLWIDKELSKKEIEKATRIKDARTDLKELQRKGWIKTQDGHRERQKAYYSIVPNFLDVVGPIVDPCYRPDHIAPHEKQNEFPENLYTRGTDTLGKMAGNVPL